MSGTSQSENTTTIHATRSTVFATLLDARSYPTWLVGAQAITDVDDDWPAVGSSFHHRIGFGPARIPGSTSIVDIDVDRSLTLRAGLGVMGEAKVRFTLHASRDDTLLEIEELPTKGILRFAHRLTGPLVPLLLWGRNEASAEDLRRLIEGSAQLDGR